MEGRRIHITGIVQGVGFRPFVALLADRHGLSGWVRNSSSGVDIEIEGPAANLEAFVEELRRGGPPLAQIESFAEESSGVQGHSKFEILASHREEGAYQPISPDIGICEDCLREMRDPSDRRYRYPFINCTNCGPRFTIIRDIPYDRPNTTMASFQMCDACTEDYSDPVDRRYHAQPIACPECGPQVWLESGGDRIAQRDEAISEARRLLADGGIVALKGLGGFHLACDATNEAAVTELRERKRREGKPFALMVYDEEAAERHAGVSDEDRNLLLSVERPVVLMDRRDGSGVVSAVAPGLNTLGIMLPYTPLHYLLMEPEAGYPEILVMTSGNVSEEPIAYEDAEALNRLRGIADAFLLHDRPIHMRCDDSVVTSFRDQIYPLRRARGYAPLPVLLPFSTPPLLATGGELKNTFCLTRENHAFLSHHIGDMENLETLRSLEGGAEHYERLFRIKPEAIACDLHPDYQATRYAMERAGREGISLVGVQHHHAHIASCMADNGLADNEPVIGVSFDGTGYGTDGAIWGGEFLVADYTDFERAFHLAYCPLPGGDAAIRNPYRTALSWLRQAEIHWLEDLPPVREAGPEEIPVLRQQLDRGLNAPPTSSMGRLFDAVASLSGLCHRAIYEAQAAIEFEAAADADVRGGYPFEITGQVIDPAPAIRDVAGEVRCGSPVSTISARFHNGVVSMVAGACNRIRHERGIYRAVLSGGVWQNRLLLRRTVEQLEREGFEVLTHRRIPANDGGLALGQAVVAARRMES